MTVTGVETWKMSTSRPSAVTVVEAKNEPSGSAAAVSPAGAATALAVAAVASEAGGASAGGGAGSCEKTGKGKVTIDRVMAKAKAAKRLSLMRLSSTRRPAAGAVRLAARKREPFSQRARMAGAHDVRRLTPPEHPEAVTPEARRACSGDAAEVGERNDPARRPPTRRRDRGRGWGSADGWRRERAAAPRAARTRPESPWDVAVAAESVKAANGSSRSSSRELPVCSPVGARPLPKPTCSRSTSSQKTSAPRPETSEAPCRRSAQAPAPSRRAPTHCTSTSGCAMLASARRPARSAAWKAARPAIARALNPPRTQRRRSTLFEPFPGLGESEIESRPKGVGKRHARDASRADFSPAHPRGR